jgi:hypothetical protein
VTASLPDDGTTAFECPRCGRPVAERFYGPCAACRSELSSRVAGTARQVASERFEPKPNVVANHVATKD